ncbi:PTS sugar transporter subunit IIA [Enterococcus cecorum]|nr:PTS sugar transporter subunit IIA [Enterococcus cecorum]
MTNILIVTHGLFGKELKKSTELITGPIQDCLALSLNRDDSIDGLESKINEYLNNTEGDTIVFVDLIGGSPFNVSTFCLKKRKDFKLVSGVNLSMLLECVMMRDNLTIGELATHCRNIGKESIKIIDES